MKKIFFKPTNKTIKIWVKSLIPPKDVFFFNDITGIDEIDKNLIGIDKYLQKYSSLEYINAYEHWNVKNKAKFCYVDDKNNFLSNDKIRNLTYGQQIDCERGLILDCDNKEMFSKFKNAFYNNKIILSNYLFSNLTYKDKKELCVSYAKSIDDWYGYLTCKIPRHIKKIANKFVKKDGCNCLSTTIYGATKDKHILNKWLDDKEFECKLKKLNYKQVKTNVKSNDIIVFKQDKKIVHACYCVDGELFLNKSGQTKYNPIVLLPFENILNDWQDCKYYIFRKESI